jgi:polyvinyl alcohol dehydrogenase (cytochrome)
LLSIAIGVAGVSALTAAGADTSDDASWIMYNHDAQGTRFNQVEATIGTSNASGLHVKWQYPTPAPVTGTPIISDGAVYAGDMAGNFYAVKTDGTLLWKKQLDASGITASGAVAGNLVVVGALGGKVYGLNKANGNIVWSMRPDPHPVSAIWGSPTKVGSNLVLGVASNEESAAANPGYPCCSTRGSLVMLDPKTGSILWRTFMITDAQLAAGASGASIWSTPAYDATRKLIYVTTGNNFSQPTTGTSDAIIAVDASTGAIRWVNQRYPNDEWNYRFPASPPDHPDYDFGDSPQVYDLPNGQRVVGAGQKSGFYHVLDATTGNPVNQIQVEPGGSLGGLFADTAVANGVVFANGINWPTPSPTIPPTGGDLIAIAGDGSHELWRYPTPQTPNMSGVAVANGVVYFTSAFFGLFALDASSGALLKALNIGASESGPAVSAGTIYVGVGDALAAGFLGQIGPGSITAIGL